MKILTFRLLAHSLPICFTMRSFRVQYWRYSLFVLIVGLGLVIFFRIVPFLGGILGASTLYVLLRGQMFYLTGSRLWPSSGAAALLLVEAVFCFLVPISLIIWLLVYKIQGVALDHHLLLEPLQRLAHLFHQRTGYDILQEHNVTRLLDLVPRLGQWIAISLFDFAINIVVLLFVLYFMLIGGCRMEIYIRDFIPFESAVAKNIVREIHLIVRSNALVIPLIAFVQGLFAYFGYLAFSAPSPLFWGLITCFATVIPLFGTTLIWLPLAAYMASQGNWSGAVGLTLYGGFVVMHIDNLVRLFLQRRMADTHPLVTLFGVFIGLSLFGFMGVIFGPLLLSLFIFCVDYFKQRFLDGIRRVHPAAVEELVEES